MPLLPPAHPAALRTLVHWEHRDLRATLHLPSIANSPRRVEGTCSLEMWPHLHWQCQSAGSRYGGGQPRGPGLHQGRQRLHPQVFLLVDRRQGPPGPLRRREVNSQGRGMDRHLPGCLPGGSAEPRSSGRFTQARGEPGRRPAQPHRRPGSGSVRRAALQPSGSVPIGALCLADGQVSPYFCWGHGLPWVGGLPCPTAITQASEVIQIRGGVWTRSPGSTPRAKGQPDPRDEPQPLSQSAASSQARAPEERRTRNQPSGPREPPAGKGSHQTPRTVGRWLWPIPRT